MISTMKVLLLFTALACICHAQRNEAAQNCLCTVFKDTVESRANITDINIFPETNFCDKVEIIITNKSGVRYCLNPNSKVAKKLLTVLARKKAN